MPAAPLLSDEEIAERLRALPEWERHGDALVRLVKRRDFADAVAFVEQLVAPADDLNHHPDVSIHWNTVTLSLWTHAAGGITDRDFRLADEIERTAAT